MATRRPCSSSTEPLAGPIDFIDLTEESSPHRSLDTSNNLKNRSHCHCHPHNLHRNLEKKTLNSTTRTSRNLTATTSNKENKNVARCETRTRTIITSSTKVKSAVTASKKNKSNINKQCQNETINLDNTNSPDNASKLICAICLGDIQTQSKPTATCCGHIFCEECLSHAMSKLKKCPRCRRSITKKSCIRLYF